MRDWEISKVLASTTGCAAFEGKVQPLSNKPLAGFRADGRYRPHPVHWWRPPARRHGTRGRFLGHGDEDKRGGGWTTRADRPRSKNVYYVFPYPAIHRHSSFWSHGVWVALRHVVMLAWRQRGIRC